MEQLTMESPDPLRAERRRSRVFMAAALIMVLAGGAGAVVYYLGTLDTTDPARVLVVLRGGLEPAFDRGLAGAFAERLTEQGFDVVSAESALVPSEDLARDLSEIRARAEAAQAANALVLDLEVAEERAGVVDGHHLYRSRLAARVVPTDPLGEALEEELEFTFEGRSALLVADSVRDTWLDTLGPAAIDLLYRTAALERVLSNERFAMDRMVFVTKLRDQRPFVLDRRSRIDTWEQHRARGREEAAHTEDGVQCLGDPSRPWSAIGVSADGRSAIVHEHYRTPIFDMLDTGRLRWTEPPESLAVVPLEGGDPRPIMRVGHFYGLASTTRDGRWASAAFFGSGVPAVVTIDTTSGAWGARWLLEARERVGRRVASPDGRAILGWRERGGWALFDGERPLVMPAFREAGFAGSGDDLRVVGQLEDERLAILRLDASPDEPWPHLSGELRGVLPASEGSVGLIVDDGDGCALRRFELASRSLSAPARLPTCVSDPSLLPDGRVVGLARHSAPGDPPGDAEVVVVDPEDASITALTRGSHREELVHASADGSRVVFSRRLGDWPADYDVRLFRRVLCWAAIPPRR